MEVLANRGETLWAVMVRVENTKSVKRYEEWQAANPDIGENQLGDGVVVKVPSAQQGKHSNDRKEQHKGD